MGGGGGGLAERERKREGVGHDEKGKEKSIPIKIAKIEKWKAHGGRWEEGKGWSSSSLFPLPTLPRALFFPFLQPLF